MAAASLAVMACQPERRGDFAEVGPEGGVVESPLGARLIVPPGALAQRTLVGLVGEGDPAAALLAVSVWPRDLAFARDAYVEMRHGAYADPEVLGLYVSTPSGWSVAQDQLRQLEQRLFVAPTRLAGTFAIIPGPLVPGGAICGYDPGYPWDAGSWPSPDGGAWPSGDGGYQGPGDGGDACDGGYSDGDGGCWWPYDDGGYQGPGDGGDACDGGYSDGDGGCWWPDYWPYDDGGYWIPDAGLPGCGTGSGGGWWWPDATSGWWVAPWCGGWTAPEPTCPPHWPRPDGGPVFEQDAG